MYVGPAGWAYEDWKDIVYPPGRPRGFDPLAYLSRYFDCVEINNTFYRMPRERVSAGWARRIEDNDRFRFTVKLYRGFTHETGRPSPGKMDSFRAGIAPLAEAGRLGAVLMQFPWSFKNVSAARDRIRELFDGLEGLPRVIEVRNSSWNTASFYSLLRDRGVGFCNIDQPVFRGSLRPSSRETAAVGYFRLHGQNYGNWFREGAGRDARYDYLYSKEELIPWAERIDALRGGLAAAYVIMNNHFKGQAVCNALQLKAILSGSRVPVPATMLGRYSQLREVAVDGGGQTELFGR